jgi:hypothetical protein
VNSPASAAACLPTRSGRAPAAGAPSSSAWLTVPGWEASSFQWVAASQAEARRAEPATNATAIRASLLRRGRGVGAGARYDRGLGADARDGRGLGAGARDGRGLGAGARDGRGLGAGARDDRGLGGRGLGAGVRYGAAAVIGGAGEDRDGFRCLATVAVRDTISFRSGAAGALNFHPAAGPAGTPRQRRAHPARVHSDRIAVTTARWVLLIHQGAPPAPVAGAELRKRQVPLRHVDHARRPIGPPGPPISRRRAS